MALLKLKIQPNADGYKIKPGAGMAEQVLEGGAPRQRGDILGAWSRIPVQWQTGPSGYDYLEAFYSLTGEKGVPFLADLILEKAFPTERTCRFVANSFGLVNQMGLSYWVQAEIWVKPEPIEYAAAIVEAYNAEANDTYTPGVVSINPTSFTASFYYPGVYSSGQTLIRLLLPEGLTFPGNFEGVSIEAEDLPTSNATFTVSFLRNDVLVASGTIVVHPNGSATGSLAMPFVTQDKDLLVLTAPNPADATLSGVSVAIPGTR